MKQKTITFLVLFFLAAAFCLGSKYLPVIGDKTSAPNTHVSDYYIEHSKEDTAADNIVSGTLADYRGFDTMLETSVMFISGLVVTLILVKEHPRKKDVRKTSKQKEEEET